MSPAAASGERSGDTVQRDTRHAPKSWYDHPTSDHADTSHGGSGHRERHNYPGRCHSVVTVDVRPEVPAPPDESFRSCCVTIAAIGRDEAAQALATSRYGSPRAVHLCNAYTLSLALRYPRFRQVLEAGDLNIADGHYVAQVARRRGHPISDVRGPQLMLDTIEAGLASGLKHYLYGSSPSTVRKLAANLRAAYPDITLVGVESPPFGDLTARQAADLQRRIAAARPDIVWVGLGTPRQDRFCANYRDRLQTTLVPVGAAFDFHAGTKPTAPMWMQRVGLEWAFRLGSEPRRLWRRYLVGSSRFLYGTLTDRRREELDRRQERDDGPPVALPVSVTMPAPLTSVAAATPMTSGAPARRTDRRLSERRQPSH